MTLQRPTATYSEDSYHFHWPDHGVEMQLDRLIEEKTDIRCELTVTYDHSIRGGKVYSGHLLLIGPNSLRDVVTHLSKADPEFLLWQPMVQQARDLAKERFRTGEPPTDLRIDVPESASRYLIRPFLLDKGVTVIFGAEESAKSMLSMVLGVVVASGQEVGGLIAESTGPLGYLDWEDDASVHRERLRAICAGAGIDYRTVHIEHKRMVASLAESVREVKRWLASIHACGAIIDSLGMACGGDPSDPQLMIKAMLAARSLDVPSLAIHHLPKDAKDKSRPYGTVYAAAEARMTWLVEKEDAEKSPPGTVRIALTNKKSNRTARHKRQSFDLVFDIDPDTEEFRRLDVRPLGFMEAAAVGTGAGLKWPIAKYLGEHPNASVADIAEAIGATRDSTRVTLNRHKDWFVNEDGWSLKEGRNSVTEHHETVLQAETYQGGSLRNPVTGVTHGDTEGEESMQTSETSPYLFNGSENPF